MLLIGWAAVGWLLGTALEAAAVWLSGERRAVCPGCGHAEQGPPAAALARALGPAGRRCPGCGSLAIWSLAGLGPLLAVAFAALAARRGLGPELLTTSFYAALLSLAAAIDLRHRLVHGLLTYPATALASLLTPLAFGQPAWSGLAGALLLAGIFLLLHRLAALLYRRDDALGRGDVMLAGMIGAMVGLPGATTALLLGVLAGGVGSLGVGLARRSRRAAFAYGPALCLGGFLTILLDPAA